jgi:hypothetical protein
MVREDASASSLFLLTMTMMAMFLSKLIFCDVRKHAGISLFVEQVK